jgi:hypothetical protein
MLARELRGSGRLDRPMILLLALEAVKSKNPER